MQFASGHPAWLRPHRRVAIAPSGLPPRLLAQRFLAGLGLGDTARIRALIKEAREIFKSLDTSITNLFRRDPEVLAKWKTATHIARAPRKRDEDAATPPAPPVG